MASLPRWLRPASMTATTTTCIATPVRSGISRWPRRSHSVNLRRQGATRRFSRLRDWFLVSASPVQVSWVVSRGNHRAGQAGLRHRVLRNAMPSEGHRTCSNGLPQRGSPLYAVGTHAGDRSGRSVPDRGVARIRMTHSSRASHQEPGAPLVATHHQVASPRCRHTHPQRQSSRPKERGMRSGKEPSTSSRMCARSLQLRGNAIQAEPPA